MSAVPPVVRDKFAYANGDLFAEASGQNRHRRVAPTELESHFKTPGSEKDKPAHWYEAQLIHYGLQPSKTKSVARMRLFDAVNAGNLAVPAHITKMEGDLKKEWAKQERDAKKEAKAKEPTGKGTKRKAIDLSVSVGGINITVSASSSSGQSTAKKAKTAATAKKPSGTSSKPPATPKKEKETKTSAKSTTTAKPKTEKKTPAKAATEKPKPEKKASAKSAAAAKPTTEKTPTTSRPKQTARRGGHLQAPVRDGTGPSPPSPPMPRRAMARRNNAFVARGRIPAPPSSRVGLGYGDEYDDDDEDDEPPPPYSECYECDDSDGDDSALGPLGLLNGRYTLRAPEVNGQWSGLYGSDPDESDFSLVLTLAGSRLWGRFDLGAYSGVLQLDQDRPFQASHARLSFTWRGREDNGPMLYGNSNTGWIRFLGSGRIEGGIDAQGIDFSGQRLPNQGTRSEIDARTMADEWESYNERQYQYENRRRWGSSSWY